MLFDLERHSLTLQYPTNRHIALLGGSGYGKTFAASQETAHRIRDGDRIVILDVSGSYTPEELARAGNAFGQHFCYYNSGEDDFTFSIYPEDTAGTLTDALVEAFEIQSYPQEALLEECCEDLCVNIGTFTFAYLFMALEDRRREYQTGEREGSSEMIKSLDSLLRKLRYLKDVERLSFVKHGTNPRTEKEPVTILQLSDFSERQKQRLSVFLLSLVWANAKNKGKQDEPGKYDAVLIDEFQHFSLTADSSFTAILREGRKYNFSAIICSQYLGDRKKAELSCLMQAGTALLFRPAASEVKLICKLFGLEDFYAWKDILLRLDVGEAVLAGSYKLYNGKVLNKPIRVTVEQDTEPLCLPEPEPEPEPEPQHKPSRRGTVTYRK